jgi:hypothetical protein
VIVGDCETFGVRLIGCVAFAKPKSSTFTVPSSRTFISAGFRLRWLTPCSHAAFKGLGNLGGDRERFVKRNWTLRDAVRERRPLDQLHDESRDAVALFEAVNLADVGMVQRGENLRLAFEAREPVAIKSEELGEDLQCDGAIELRVMRAIDLAHAARADGSKNLVRAEARAGVRARLSWIIRGGTAAETKLLLLDADMATDNCCENRSLLGD